MEVGLLFRPSLFVRLLIKNKKRSKGNERHEGGRNTVTHQPTRSHSLTLEPRRHYFLYDSDLMEWLAESFIL